MAIPQFIADRLLLLQQSQRLLQPPPRPQDQRLIPVPGLSCILIAALLRRPSRALAELLRFRQPADALCQRIALEGQLTAQTPQPAVWSGLQSPPEGAAQVAEILLTIAPIRFPPHELLQ